MTIDAQTLAILQLSDPAILCRTSQQPKSDAEIHAHWLRKEVAKLLPMAEVSSLFNNALPLAHAIAEFIAGDLIVKTEFSPMQVASVSTDSCDTSATCKITAKTVNAVYDNSSKTLTTVLSGQHIRLHRDDPVQSAIKSLVKDDTIDSPDAKYKLALFNNDPVVDGEKKKSKDVEKPLKILDQGTIVNIGCNDVVFKGDSGQYTLLKLGNIITDTGASTFTGTLNPTKGVISAHVKLYSQDQITAKTQVTELYGLQFGLGQVRFSTTATAMPACDNGSTDGCIMNASIGEKLGMLKGGMYIKLESNSNSQYPYTLNVFNKDGTAATPASEGSFAIANMNDQYLMLKNDNNVHVLIGLSKMLDQASIAFTGVTQDKLTPDYIDANAANGSKTPLISNYLFDKKFSALNAGDTSAGGITTICSNTAITAGCPLSISKVGTIGGNDATTNTNQGIFSARSSKEYLKLTKATNGDIELKLYDDTNTVKSTITVAATDGFYVDYPKVLIMNKNTANPNVILDLENELGTAGAAKSITLTVPATDTFSDFTSFSDDILMNELNSAAA